jgi:glyoxylase I family protein
MGADRAIGFMVEGLEEAMDQLRRLGVEVDTQVAVNERWRYAHFRAPDGHVYELVEPLGRAAAQPPEAVSRPRT